MTDTKKFPSTTAAFEAGRKAGAEEERARLAAQQEQHEEPEGPAPLTLDSIRTGQFSDDELIERGEEVDRLLAGEGR